MFFYTDKKKIWNDVGIFICIFNIIEVSYSQPKLSGCAQWNSHGITLADETVVGIEPKDIFIDRNNTIYVLDHDNGRIQMWNANSKTPMTIPLDYWLEYKGFFVSLDESIYIGHKDDGTIEKWSRNGTKSAVVMKFDDSCFALFVDINNYLYCSMINKDQVVKQPLDGITNMSIRVAGTGILGDASDMLTFPRGIFVDINLDLYVADYGNNRIQLFKAGQLNGTTVAGVDSTPSIALYNPTAVFLDADGYSFIVDTFNYRIIGSRSNGFFCVVGCSHVIGSASDQLDMPNSAAFDSYGNIYVTDTFNDRIQKFNLLTNISGK